MAGNHTTVPSVGIYLRLWCELSDINFNRINGKLLSIGTVVWFSSLKVATSVWFRICLLTRSSLSSQVFVNVESHFFCVVWLKMTGPYVETSTQNSPWGSSVSRRCRDVRTSTTSSPLMPLATAAKIKTVKKICCKKWNPGFPLLFFFKKNLSNMKEC